MGFLCLSAKFVKLSQFTTRTVFLKLQYQTVALGAAAERSNPTSKEWWLHRRRRAERSYSTFKVRRGGCEEITLIQGKEQWLRFAGAAMKRYPTSKVRETQVKW